VFSARRGNDGIWIVNRDGSGARLIAAAKGSDAYYYTPTWTAR
jgi:hypothetical protein